MPNNRRAIFMNKCLITLIAICATGLTSVSAQMQQKYYIGDGGKGIRLAVLEPTGKGLSVDEQWMLSLVQGSITGDFNKYSAITIIDRQNLEKVFSEWEEAMSGNYSDEDRVRFGNLTNANHILTGSVSKTANAIMLELTITDVVSGERKASYSPTPVSQFAIENLSAIKAASVDLLGQLGINLTQVALSELKQTANTTRLQAETMLARGIVAQRQGTEVAALSYFFQAAALDSSLLEASTRSSVMTANITSGNIGADIRNDIVWRKNWVARLKETEETFYYMINSAAPPYTLYYSTKIQTGNINYEEETADLSIVLEMNANKTWFSALERAYQAILDGLNATNRKSEWKLAGWPHDGVSNTNPFASSEKKLYDISVTFELLNEQGRVIGIQAVSLHPSTRIISNDVGQITIEFTDSVCSPITFNAVSADDISDNLTIRVASVNGAPPESAQFTIIAMNSASESICTNTPKLSINSSASPQHKYKGKPIIGFSLGGGYSTDTLCDAFFVSFGGVYSYPTLNNIVSFNTEGSIWIGKTRSEYDGYYNYDDYNIIFGGFSLLPTVLFQLSIFSIETGLHGDLLFGNDKILSNVGLIAGVGVGFSKKQSQRYFYRYCSGNKYGTHIVGAWCLF